MVSPREAAPRPFDWGPPAPRHTYSVGTVSLFVQLVIDTACSLRSSSAVIGLLAKMWPESMRTPVANTGQEWLLRIGLHEVTRPKEVADDWCWIIDHTIQIGTLKFLLIVGIRLSVFQRLQRPLQHRDLQMMALEPVEKSDGPTVARPLEATCRQTGIVPRLLHSDEGTDWIRGYEEFLSHHPETAVCHDIAHLAAKFLKHELDADPRWAIGWPSG